MWVKGATAGTVSSSAAGIVPSIWPSPATRLRGVGSTPLGRPGGARAAARLWPVPVYLWGGGGQVAVREHHPLGAPRGAAGVGQRDQVLAGIYRDGGRALAAGEQRRERRRER